LGLNIPELRKAARPFTVREGKAIDTGLTREILDVGKYDGDFGKFLMSRPAKYQRELLGPNRLRLLNEGKIEFKDIVDKNGVIRLLKKDKDGKVIGLMK